MSRLRLSLLPSDSRDKDPSEEELEVLNRKEENSPSSFGYLYPICFSLFQTDFFFFVFFFVCLFLVLVLVWFGFGFVFFQKVSPLLLLWVFRLVFVVESEEDEASAQSSPFLFSTSPIRTRRASKSSEVLLESFFLYLYCFPPLVFNTICPWLVSFPTCICFYSDFFFLFVLAFVFTCTRYLRILRPWNSEGDYFVKKRKCFPHSFPSFYSCLTHSSVFLSMFLVQWLCPILLSFDIHEQPCFCFFCSNTCEKRPIFLFNPVLFLSARLSSLISCFSSRFSEEVDIRYHVLLLRIEILWSRAQWRYE